MGHRGSVPPDEGTVEVLGGWRAEPDPHDDHPSRPVLGVLVVLAVAAVVVGGSWATGRPPDEAPTPATGSDDRAASRTSDPTGDLPARFDQPVGHRVVVLTLTGLLALDPDTGSYDDLELGPIRSFGSAPAVAALGPSTVAVLLADGSVGAVDLDDRSIRRIAEDVQAVLPAAEPGTAWIRQHRPNGHWELTRIDEAGQAVEVSTHPPSPVPPRIVGGEPGVVRAVEPRPLGPPDAAHLVELHERPGSYYSFGVRIVDRATGGEWWLRDLSNPPVLTPDGRFLLVGERITNRLTAYDLATAESSTLQAPESAGVTLDWENVAVLPRGV